MSSSRVLYGRGSRGSGQRHVCRIPGIQSTTQSLCRPWTKLVRHIFVRKACLTTHKTASHCHRWIGQVRSGTYNSLSRADPVLLGHRVVRALRLDATKSQLKGTQETHQQRVTPLIGMKRCPGAQTLRNADPQLRYPLFAGKIKRKRREAIMCYSKALNG